MAVDPARVKSLFLAASELSDAGQREAHLDRECRGDLELRARVEALLRAHESEPIRVPEGEREAATVDSAAPALAHTENLPGEDDRASTVIAGKYTLIEVIGEGGMGSVWRAKQTEPVKRFVAVKLIKPGMDSKQVLARFDAERQALALMDHPNIAKVLDGGLHEHRPYFVMELVKGVPITEFCDSLRLAPRERLELFVSVCEAIQHAHQKGIIHRDIKPSNVLIALYDDKPVVKVIDFGVAKATGGTLTEATIDTGFGAVVGTPQYMSPEQAMLNNLDIDTRSDLYALGVLLYELLTGSPPFSQQELQARGLLEMLRVVLEEEPSRPSTKLSTADALPSISANRSMDPKKLTGLLRNELDWIVMKALEKDRARRYETANGFAADVRRYLDGEAVQAHPPSSAYRLQKFVRRNKVQVIAASLVLLALVVGVIGFAWQANIANRQRQLAELAREAADEQRDRAIAAEKKTAQRAAELKQVSAFQAAMLAKIDQTRAGELLTNDVLSRHSAALVKAGVPEAERDAHRQAFAAEWQRVNAVDTAVGLIDREILAPAVRAVDTQFKDQPLVGAQLRSELASLYGTLGKFDAAQPLADLVFATRRQELGEKHPDTLTAQIELGWIYLELAKHAEAEACFREALALGRAAFGDDHDISRRAEGNLVVILGYLGKNAEAEPYARDVVERNRRILGADHPRTLATMADLAMTLGVLGKTTEEAAILKDAMEARRRTQGNDHPNTLEAIANYAGVAPRAEQEGLIREVVDTRRRVLGEEHFETVWATHLLAYCLAKKGKLSEAEAMFREAHTKMRRLRGEDHMNTVTMARGLAWVLHKEGKTAEAETILSTELDKCRRVYGPSGTETPFLLERLAGLLQEAGRHDEAEPLLRELLAITRKTLPAGHPKLITAMSNLANVYANQGKTDQAIPLVREVIESSRASQPKESPELAGQLTMISQTLFALKAWDEAEPLLRECLAIREKTQPDDWTMFNSQSMLGGVLLSQNKLAEAEPLLVKGYEGMKEREATIPPQGEARLTEALERLIVLYSVLEKPDDVIRWQAELDRHNNKSPQPDSPKPSPPDDNQSKDEAAKDDGN